MADTQPTWVQSQRKTFSKWLLARLGMDAFPPGKDSLELALQVFFKIALRKNQIQKDGVLLIELTNKLWKQPKLPHKPHPTTLIQMLDNGSVALEMVKRAGSNTAFRKTKS